MFEGQRPKSSDVFLSAGAILQTLFNTRTFPVNLNNTILVDTLKDTKVGDFGKE